MNNIVKILKEDSDEKLFRFAMLGGAISSTLLIVYEILNH